MQHNGVFNNGQTQARSACLSRPAAIDAVESFKDAWKMLFINLATCIWEGEVEEFIILQITGQVDIYTLTSIFNDIVEQVLKYWEDERLVSVYDQFSRKIDV